MQKVSYLIALYNKEKYIIEAINSILSDTSPNVEIEICVVDDGSTDKSASLVQDIFKNHPQVKFEALDSNKGKNTAYNRAFAISSGDYISLMGADDTIIKGRTKHLLEKTMLTGNATYGGFIKVFEGTSRVETHLLSEQINFQKNIIQNQLPGGCFMMPRELAETIFPIPEHLKFEDWWISFHLLRANRVQTTNEPVLFYRIHEENNWDVSNTSRKAQMKNHYLRDIPYLEEFIPFLKGASERNLYKRALAIRHCHVGKKPYSALIYPPYDKSWLKLLINIIATPSVVHYIEKQKSLIRARKNTSQTY